MKVDELVGSLQTFEMSINERGDKKNKSIAFVTNTDDEESQADCEKEESIADALMLIGRQFNKVLRHVDRRSRQNGQNIVLDVNKQQNSLKKTRTEEKNDQTKEV
jgi:hypothetical protein